MRRRYSAVAVFLATLVVTCSAPVVHAQADAFAQAVRTLAGAAASEAAESGQRMRAAVDRMSAALAEWDRDISALEQRVNHELQGASGQRAFQPHVELGLAYHRRGRFDDALREFDAAAAASPSASDVHVLRALTLEAGGRFQQAGPAFRDAWTRDRDSPVKAYYFLHRTRTSDDGERRTARATLVGAYQRLLSGTPAPRRRSGQAAPFLTLGVIPDAISSTPVVGDASTTEGFALLVANKFDEAVAALRRADRSTPDNSADSPLGQFARGRGYEIENRVPEARRAYQSVIAGTLAGRSSLYVGIGRLAQVDGDGAAAIDALVHAVRLNPNDSIIRRELAGVYAAEDRSDEAFAELVAALLIDPGDALAFAAIGQLHLDAGRPADAVPALSRALALMPDRFETHYALGTALSRLGRTSDAAREFDAFERASRDALQRRRGVIAPLLEADKARQ